MILIYLFLFSTIDVSSQSELEAKTRYFTKCLLRPSSKDLLTCNLIPFTEVNVSSKSECAHYCASVGSDQEITFDNKLSSSSSLYIFNYTDHGTFAVSKNNSYLLNRPPGERPLVGEVQVCLGFNYQDRNGTCQLFDQPCPAPNITLVTDRETGVYYSVVPSFKSLCYFGEIEDCSNVPGTGPKDSGIYWIKIDNQTYPVYCQITSSSNKYTIFQRRMDGSVNFLRGWVDYENGFGNIDGEYWFGNYLIHRLTYIRDYRLRVELEKFDGESEYSEYDEFSVGPPSSKYLLSLKLFSGPAGDSMLYHNGEKFSTIDQNNDKVLSYDCVTKYKGAWWHHDCILSNLNSIYVNTSAYTPRFVGIIWSTFGGYHESMKACRMMIERK